MRAKQRIGPQAPAYRPQTAARPKTASPSPAMAAPQWQTAAALPFGARRPRTRAADCAHLSDKKIWNLGKAARRGGHYMSHTDRYDRDHAYRMICQALVPPTPRQLQYNSLEWAADDGSDF